MHDDEDGGTEAASEERECRESGSLVESLVPSESIADAPPPTFEQPPSAEPWRPPHAVRPPHVKMVAKPQLQEQPQAVPRAAVQEAFTTVRKRYAQEPEPEPEPDPDPDPGPGPGPAPEPRQRPEPRPEPGLQPHARPCSDSNTACGPATVVADILAELAPERDLPTAVPASPSESMHMGSTARVSTEALWPTTKSSTPPPACITSTGPGFESALEAPSTWAGSGRCPVDEPQAPRRANPVWRRPPSAETRQPRWSTSLPVERLTSRPIRTPSGSRPADTGLCPVHTANSDSDLRSISVPTLARASVQSHAEACSAHLLNVSLSLPDSPQRRHATAAERVRTPNASKCTTTSVQGKLRPAQPESWSSRLHSLSGGAPPPAPTSQPDGSATADWLAQTLPGTRTRPANTSMAAQRPPAQQLVDYGSWRCFFPRAQPPAAKRLPPGLMPCPRAASRHRFTSPAQWAQSRLSKAVREHDINDLHNEADAQQTLVRSSTLPQLGRATPLVTPRHRLLETSNAPAPRRQAKGDNDEIQREVVARPRMANLPPENETAAERRARCSRLQLYQAPTLLRRRVEPAVAATKPPIAVRPGSAAVARRTAI